MAKYIIDVPDEAVEFMGGEMNFLVEPKIKDERRRHYVLRIDEEDVSIYTESDRKAIEEEVWKMARLISLDGGLSSADLYECYKSSDIQKVMRTHSYQEAKAKYDAWKQLKEEIRVGCEVHHKELPELKIYVTDMDDNSFGGFALCSVKNVCDYGDRFSECNVHQYKPTGRVLPNIVELLKKMMEVD